MDLSHKFVVLMRICVYFDISCSVQFISVTQLCLTLCDPMDCSTPGFLVHHHLLELAPTHVHQVSDAIQPSHPLLSPSPPTFNLSQHQVLFQAKGIGASASAWVLPMNIQGWFSLGLTGLISLLSKGHSRVFSSTTIRKYQFLALSLLYGPTPTSVHDYWKNHSFDYIDLCWQGDVSAF